MTRQTGMRRMARMRAALALAAASAFGLVSGLAATAQTANLAPTHTTLTAQTSLAGAHSVTTFQAKVEDNAGYPASGVLVLIESGKGIGSSVLDATGAATIQLDSLASRDHTIVASYQGDKARAGSQSQSVELRPEVTGTPSFTLSVTPTTLTLAPGTTGSMTATVAAVNGFTGFISFSCSGPPLTTGAPGGSALPYGVSCVFTPTNEQITSTTSTAGLTSDISIITTAPSVTSASSHLPASGSASGGKTLALAILLPGVVGLSFLGRRRKLFGSVTMLLLIGAVGALGTTACAARYRYLNHPPTYNGGTAAGTYPMTITAQTSDGVTASGVSIPIVLTVN